MSDSEEETRERQTIVSENILPKTFLLSDTAVEDYLFEEANLTVDKVMALLLTDPLNSHLLTMDRVGYGAIRDHIAAYLRDTEERIRRSVDVAEIRRLEKSLMVATVLNEALEQLSTFHIMPLRMKNLPLGNISSEDDKRFIMFKEKCGLTDFASTDVPRRKLVVIKKVALMLGLGYSPYFTINGFSHQSGSSLTRNQLREHICEVFQIPIPRDD